MKTEQSKFILLRKIKYGESDLILHGLSNTGARKSFIARGALKSKKRFGGGVLEPIHFVNLTFKTNEKPDSMNQLLEAQLLEDFSGVRKTFAQLELALYVVRCVGGVSQEEDLDSSFLFNLTGHVLRKIADTEGAKELLRLKLHFNLKFLFQQGVIEIEDWMRPFLKINLSGSEMIDEIPQVQDAVDTYLDSMDSMVEHYLKAADVR